MFEAAVMIERLSCRKVWKEKSLNIRLYVITGAEIKRFPCGNTKAIM
jgi:hypothetical protein